MDEFFGIFGNSGRTWATTHRNRYQQEFAECERLIAECNGALHRRTVQGTTQLLVSMLFARCIEHFQAAVLLVEHGMVAGAKAVLRAECEAMFGACAISRDDAAAQAYLDDDLRQRLKLLNKAANNTGPALERIRAAAMTERGPLKLQVESAGAKELKTEELAKLAGLHDWYLSVYTLLSRSVHSHVRDLDRHVARGAQGSIEALTTGPSEQETQRLLAIGALALVNARGALGDAYKENTNTFIDEKEPLFRQMIQDWVRAHPNYDEWGI